LRDNRLCLTFVKHLLNAIDMQVTDLLERALRLEFLTAEEGVFLLEQAPTAELAYVGNAMRQRHVPGNVVTWIIDRNSPMCVLPTASFATSTGGPAMKRLM